LIGHGFLPILKRSAIVEEGEENQVEFATYASIFYFDWHHRPPTLKVANGSLPNGHGQIASDRGIEPMLTYPGSAKTALDR
jgi:hypothetical protein